MEAVNQMLEIVSGIILNLIGNVALYSVLGGIIGVVISIVFVRKAKRHGWMNRSNSFWSFLAKTSYVLMPIGLLLTGIIQGGIWGAHNTAVELIDDSTRPVIEYAAAYIPQIQSFVDSHVLPEGSSMREIVETHNEVIGSQEDGFVMEQFNILVLGAFLETMPNGAFDMADPLLQLRNVNLLNIDAQDFEIIPSTMRAVTAFYMAPFYWMCLVPFLTYLLAAMVECILFHFFFKRGTPSQETYSNMQFA